MRFGTRAMLRGLGRMIPALILLTLAFFMFLGPVYFPATYWVIVAFAHMILLQSALSIVVGLLRAIRFMSRKDLVFELEENCDPLIRHVIVVPNYRESIEMLTETLAFLAGHRYAKQSYSIILAMEESDPDALHTAKTLRELFENDFWNISASMHPKNIPGEAQGKSSNVCFAAKTFSTSAALEGFRYLLTVIDGNEPILFALIYVADTLLSESYFAYISQVYSTVRSRPIMFAPSIVFDRNANSVPSCVRIADICWCLGVLGSFATPIKFPCSVYTIPYELAKQVGFWDVGPESIGEDMHMTIKCYTATKMMLDFHPVFFPASCCNVQGSNYVETINERLKQAFRHLWGVQDIGFAVFRLHEQGCWFVSPALSCFLLLLLLQVFYQPFLGMMHLTGNHIYPSSFSTPLTAFLDAVCKLIRFLLIPVGLTIPFLYMKYHSSALNLRLRHNYHGSHISRHQVAHLLDWLIMPFTAFLFYFIPLLNAVIRQVRSNKMTYRVSSKPKVNEQLQHETDVVLMS